MTTRLTLIVHGETSATRRAAFPLDEPLEPRGRDAIEKLLDEKRQVERAPVGKLARGWDRALASPAPAARDTAALLGLDADVDTALRDVATGTWAGRALADVAAADPTGAAAFIADPAFAGHGGESIDALIVRVKAWLTGRHAKRGRIVAVTHQAVVRAAIVAALETPASAFWQLDVAPLGAVTLTSNGRRWALRVGAADVS